MLVKESLLLTKKNSKSKKVLKTTIRKTQITAIFSKIQYSSTKKQNIDRTKIDKHFLNDMCQFAK